MFLCSIIIVLGFMWGQNTITVYGATVTTPDGYTVERRGGYGPAEVSLKSYSGTDSELTLPRWPKPVVGEIPLRRPTGSR